MTRHTEEIKTKRVNKTQAAKRLGVTREHLSRVLHGHRQSRRLMTAWLKLLETQQS